MRTKLHSGRLITTIALVSILFASGCNNSSQQVSNGSGAKVGSSSSGITSKSSANISQSTSNSISVGSSNVSQSNSSIDSMKRKIALLIMDAKSHNFDPAVSDMDEVFELLKTYLSDSSTRNDDLTWTKLNLQITKLGNIRFIDCDAWNNGMQTSTMERTWQLAQSWSGSNTYCTTMWKHDQLEDTQQVQYGNYLFNIGYTLDLVPRGGVQYLQVWRLENGVLSPAPIQGLPVSNTPLNISENFLCPTDGGTPFTVTPIHDDTFRFEVGDNEFIWKYDQSSEKFVNG